jgi:hypothetical protein
LERGREKRKGEREKEDDVVGGNGLGVKPGR